MSVLSAVAVRGEGFVTDLNFGLTLNQGNTDNSALHVGLETAMKTETDEFRASVSYKYGETTREEQDGTETTFASTDNAEAKLNYNRLFSERFYGLLAFSAFRDELASIEYRVLTGPGLGWYVVKNEVWTLAVEGGVSYLMQEVDGETLDETVFRFAQRYERDLNEDASVWQNLEYLPVLDEFGDYLLNGEIGARAKLNGALSLRVVLSQRYDSTPAEENEKRDVSLVAGISYRF